MIHFSVFLLIVTAPPDVATSDRDNVALAKAALDAGNCQRARVALERLSPEAWAAPGTAYLRGKTYECVGDFEKALDGYRAYDASVPNILEVRDAIGRLLMRREDFLEQARARQQRAREEAEARRLRFLAQEEEERRAAVRERAEAVAQHAREEVEELERALRERAAYDAAVADAHASALLRAQHEAWATASANRRFTFGLGAAALAGAAGGVAIVVGAPTWTRAIGPTPSLVAAVSLSIATASLLRFWAVSSELAPKTGSAFLAGALGLLAAGGSAASVFWWGRVSVSGVTSGRLGETWVGPLGTALVGFAAFIFYTFLVDDWRLRAVDRRLCYSDLCFGGPIEPPRVMEVPTGRVIQEGDDAPPARRIRIISPNTPPGCDDDACGDSPGDTPP